MEKKKLNSIGVRVKKFIGKGIAPKQAEILAKLEKEIHELIKKIPELDWSNAIIDEINIFYDIEIEDQEVVGFTIYPCVHDTIGFSTIPDVIGELKSLQKLKIIGFEGYGLFSFPESLTCLKSLKSLTLTENTMTTLPDSIGNLVSIQELKLIGNGLIKLPESIGRLSSLELLDLSCNQLITIPDAITTLKSLKILNLAQNRVLKTVPESLISRWRQKKLSINLCETLIDVPASEIYSLYMKKKNYENSDFESL